MPYTTKGETKGGKVTVVKKDYGKVVGHTSKKMLPAYLRALYAHAKDK